MKIIEKIECHNWDTDALYPYEKYELFLKRKYIGYIRVDHGYICGLWIEPQYRRQGYAKQIISYIMNMYNEVALTVHPNNGSAIALYKSVGFVIEREDQFRIYMKWKREND